MSLEPVAAPIAGATLALRPVEPSRIGAAILLDGSLGTA